MPDFADLPLAGPTLLSSMGQLAALLGAAGVAERVQIALALPSETELVVVEIDHHGACLDEPMLRPRDAETLLGDADVIFVEDLAARAHDHPSLAAMPDVAALAIARVRSTGGAVVGHVMLACSIPRHWTAGQRQLIAQGAGLAQAIAEAAARTRSEQEFRETTASREESPVRLARIVESAMNAIISVDEERRIVMFNAAAERIFRVDAAAAIGAPIDRVLPPALGEGHARKIGQLREGQKMEAMGRLASGAAHDFNNLLTVIRSGADFLLSELPTEGELRRDAEDILAAADRAACLTRQLLAFARRQVPQSVVLDLNSVITDVERLLRRVIGEDIALGVMLAPMPMPVLADAGQLEQVLVNLSVNARDAMPSGGSLLLTTEMREGGNVPDVFPQWPGPPPDHAVLFSMCDSGAGMNAAILARAFEPFFTTKEPGRGTGLGLATVYGIVQQLGGLVAIESTPGHGTTIWMALPLTNVAPSLELAGDGAAIAMAGHGTILLIEDDDAVRAMLHRVLTRVGYHLIEARNAVEGHFLWRRHGGPTGGINLVLTDMIMPGSTGRELATRLRAEHANVPVLFISGYLEGGVGSDDDPLTTRYLEKPFTSRRLLDEVRKLLARDH